MCILKSNINTNHLSLSLALPAKHFRKPDNLIKVLLYVILLLYVYKYSTCSLWNVVGATHTNISRLMYTFLHMHTKFCPRQSRRRRRRNGDVHVARDVTLGLYNSWKYSGTIMLLLAKECRNNNRCLSYSSSSGSSSGWREAGGMPESIEQDWGLIDGRTDGWECRTVMKWIISMNNNAYAQPAQSGPTMSGCSPPNNSKAGSITAIKNAWIAWKLFPFRLLLGHNSDLLRRRME